MSRRALVIASLLACFVVDRSSAQDLDCDQVKSTTVPFQLTIDALQPGGAKASGLLQVFRSNGGELTGYSKIGSAPVTTSKRRGIFMLEIALDKLTFKFRYADVDVSAFNMKENHTYLIYGTRTDGNENPPNKVEYEFVSTEEKQISGCSFALISYRTKLYRDKTPLSSLEGDYSPELQTSLVTHTKMLGPKPVETSVETQSIQTHFEPLMPAKKPN